MPKVSRRLPRAGAAACGGGRAGERGREWHTVCRPRAHGAGSASLCSAHCPASRSVPTHTHAVPLAEHRCDACCAHSLPVMFSRVRACVRAASISAARQGACCRQAARTAWPRRCGRRSICYAHCNGARGAASALRLGYLDAGRHATLASHPTRYHWQCRERTMFQYTLLVPLRRIRMLQISTVAAEMCENAELSLDSRGRPTSGAV